MAVVKERFFRIRKSLLANDRWFIGCQEEPIAYPTLIEALDAFHRTPNAYSIVYHDGEATEIIYGIGRPVELGEIAKYMGDELPEIVPPWRNCATAMTAAATVWQQVGDRIDNWPSGLADMMAATRTVDPRGMAKP